MIPFKIVTSITFFIFNIKCVFPLNNQINYFPLQVGNSWEYQYAYPDTGYAFKRLVRDTVKIFSKTYYILSDDYHGNISDIIVRQDSVGNIWRYNHAEGNEYLWFNFTLPDSSKYYYQPCSSCDSFLVTIYHNIEMETSAGKFDNCIQFFFDIQNMFDEEQWYIFAPQIGIIKIQYGNVKEMLLKAQINGNIISNVDSEIKVLQTFSLSQNYPNPFNPLTTIKYQIAKKSFVTIKIYDLLGREMRTLINESKKAGVYEIIWDGKDKDAHSIPSGVYIYKIKAGNFVQSKKMLSIK